MMSAWRRVPYPLSSRSLRTHRRRSVSAIRHFNRFYTGQIGLLQQGLLATPFSLTEVRLLYEIAHHHEGGITAAALAAELGLDPGYLSRILGKFEKRGWIHRQPSSTDRRQSLLTLTAKGSATFRPLEERSNQQVREMIAPISSAGQQQLVGAMQVSSRFSRLRPAPPSPICSARISPAIWAGSSFATAFSIPRSTTMTSVLRRWWRRSSPSSSRSSIPKHERCWIAERNGERVGSVYLVRKSATVSKLRLLLVEPSARSLGIGRRLVEECIRFARQTGYKKMMLWTQSELKAARAIYQKAGFELTAEEKHDSWGRKGLVAETWELEL